MMNEDMNSGIKRSSDELIQTDDVSSDTMMNAEENHLINNNDAKKVKLDSRNEPSKVIHIGNIPDDISEAEIIQLGTPFGKVTQVLVLKGKNQAFLELSDESAATAMVNYFSSSTAQLRGRVVYVQFSNHKELKTDRTSNAVENQSSTQALLQSSHPLVSESDTQGGPSSVLRIVVKHMIYPVTLDVLHQIFSKVGKVMKIVTFTKNNTFQALIQYPDAVAAQAAKMTMDGQNVYNDCCTLRIEYSKSNNLNVKYNNDKSRDYTNHSLPTGDAALDSALAMGGMPFTGMPLAGVNPTAAAYGAARMHMAGQSLSCVLHVSNLNEEMVTPDALFTLFGVYGDVHRVKILYNKKDNALIQMSEPQQTQLALSYLNKLRIWGKSIRVTLSKHRFVQLPKEGQPDVGLSKDYSNSSLHRFKKPGSKNYQNIYPPSSTLHLSNIPPAITEEQIRDAFEKAGCAVKAFKFFPSKERKMALIQLESNEEAVLALIKMHNYQLADSSHLRVSFSKSTI